MRRRIVFSLAAFLLLAGLLTGLYQHLSSTGKAGYVIIGLGEWVIETSFYVVVLFVLTLFVSLNVAVFLAVRAARLPEAMKQRNLVQRQRRSEEALAQGFIETIEGKWDKAERSLIRHASDSGLPLINYLVAARAAHLRGAMEQREEYLERAVRVAPQASLAVALLRARLLLETRDSEAALEALNEINQSHPNLPLVLRLLRTGYEQTMDEEALHYLIPSLREAKLYPEAELRALEVDIYSRLLDKRALTKDPALIREVWRWVPTALESEDTLVLRFCRGMIGAGRGAEVEEPLRLALGRNWTAELLALYGEIEGEDPLRQLSALQEWLGPHRDDPDLYGVMAKVARRAGETDRAIRFARTALELAPSADAFKVLGDVFFERREDVAASRLYRQGLRFERGEEIEPELVVASLALLGSVEPSDRADMAEH